MNRGNGIAGPKGGFARGDDPRRGSRLTHGMTGTPEHRTWKSIIGRCENPKNPKFPIYGGRGIVVCSDWRASFQAFFRDMGRRPSSAHSIDRINVDGNYEPANCRWATAKEQNRNKTNARLIAHGGLTLSITEWAELRGLPESALRIRLDRLKWSVADALNRPLAMRSSQKAAEVSR